MVSNIFYCLFFVTLLCHYSGSLPQSFSPFFSQDEQPEQQPEQQQEEKASQAETINENFYDEVRQLLEQKSLDNSEAVANVAPVTTTTAAGPNSDERILDSTTLNNAEHLSTERTILQNIPKPQQISDWPKLDLRLGQVVAISIGIDGHPVIFHRADRVWTEE